MALSYKYLVWQQVFDREQRISTSLWTSSLSIIVSMHLGQPIWSMESLLVDMRHGRAGDIKNVVAVGHSDWLSTDKTKVAECFTWLWISVSVAGAQILDLILGVVTEIVVIVLLVIVLLLILISITDRAVTWRCLEDTEVPHLS